MVRSEKARIISGSPASGESEGLLTGAILKLATSRGVVIAISFATAPILGRLFLPHAYGALGVLGTLISMIALFASLSYVNAIPLAGSLVERRDLFVLCSSILLCATIVVVTLSFLFADTLAKAFSEPDVAKYAYFLPLMFIAAGLRQLIDTTLSCQKRFSAVAIRNILEVSVTRASQLGLCLVGFLGSPVALIVGSLAGSLAAALTSGITSIREIFRSIEGGLNLAGIRAVAAKYRKFPLVQLWSGSINAITFGLPAIVLGVRYSVEVVGLYNMAYSMAALPLQLFVGGANQVFYVEAGERTAHRQSLAPSAMHLIRVIAILTSLPLVTIFVLGPLVFELFLGPKWREAGVFAQMLVPWMAVMAVSQPLATIYAILSRQGEGFFWNIALVMGRFSALYFGGMWFGVRATLGLFVVVSVLIIAGLMWRSLFLLGVSRKWAAWTIIRSYSVSFLLLLPAGILYWILGLRFASMGALALGCVTYAWVIYVQYPEMIRPLLPRGLSEWASRFNKPAGASTDVD